MNLKELKEIIDIVTSKESIQELELEKSGVRLRIKRASSHASSVSGVSAETAAPAVPAIAPHAAPQETPQKGRRRPLLHQITNCRHFL